MPTPLLSVKVPRWLTWLFPNLVGLENNPLYVRFSGQGYGTKKRWYAPAVPAELRPKGANFLQRIGFLPLVLLIAVFPVGLPLLNVFLPAGLLFLIAFFPAGLLLLLLRASGRGTVSAPAAFMRNGATEPWGEMLYLTRLRPVDYDRALFASTLEKSAQALPAVFVLAVLLAGFIGGISQGSGAPGSPLTWMAVTAIALVPVGAEFFFFVTLRVAMSLGEAVESARHGTLGSFLNELAVLPILALSHAAGFFVVYFYLVIVLEPLGIAKAARWFTVLSSLYVFVVPSMVVQLLLTRRVIRNTEGALGRAFMLLINNR